mmetsp:Transcript_18774/g.52460  ORF Transcript_18774/g.52460 Transcript_18774/m.52460 type:complete len:183 (-) Transcript_18774:154-702(-)|eukprot:CAMPEP_0172368020 /NCGR_PEP_ID=MMETSP1060-20121228/24868_1 /TAXON_ID=37318 /ORGANISM="Pseudo-nitzschia pungens, Strain cf. cingulata" /LENGTH=182 /DNA_ID=CAMNT_0013092475 /DNA_START=123 /DNA_END=671 /DNA_ORIENTATION=-
MKSSVGIILAVVLSASGCDAFSTPSHSRNAVLALAAANTENSESDQTGVLSRRTAAAAIFTGAVSLIAAPKGSVADTSLDFSLPSYDTKMSGFGEGNEAYIKKGKIANSGEAGDALMADPGSDEKEKQAAAMRKAEEARKAALAKKNAERKAMEEDAKRRAQEKKARDKERLKNMWSSDFSE